MSSFRVTNWLEYKYRPVSLAKYPNVPGSIDVSSFSVRYSSFKESKPSNILGVTTVRSFKSSSLHCLKICKGTIFTVFNVCINQVQTF